MSIRLRTFSLHHPRLKLQTMVLLVSQSMAHQLIYLCSQHNAVWIHQQRGPVDLFGVVVQLCLLYQHRMDLNCHS